MYETFKNGSICPVCERGQLSLKIEDIDFDYHGDTLSLSEEVWKCDGCGEFFFRDKKRQKSIEKLLTDRRRFVDGLLTSKEIVAIRKKLGMTQTQIARALRVATKNFARYESGQATQGHAIDDLLRILGEIPEAIEICQPGYRPGSISVTIKRDLIGIIPEG
jgi:HTH-type transcriptional regulator/antitoxin MqsA